MQSLSRQQVITQLAEALTQQQGFMVTAESCTGGGIAQALTAMPGSSAWFDSGFVTYSNQAKSRLLSVPETMIAEQGAVSEAVVRRMVSGALANSQGRYAVAVSGVAGPGGGSAYKPVGTVWIAWGNREHSEARQWLFSGDREAIREQTVDTALAQLLAFVEADSTPDYA